MPKLITFLEYQNAKKAIKIANETIKMYNEQELEVANLNYSIKKSNEILTPETYIRDIKIYQQLYNHIAKTLSHKKNKYFLQVKDLQDPNLTDIRYHKDILALYRSDLKKLLFNCKIEMK